jgi:NAD(P)-dependent dehydrogenase (short-subunit alcohol dehydrogenase family)
MKLNNKTAVVTGASTGIGRAVSIEFAREGAFTLLVGKNETGLIETEKQIQDIGGKSKIILCDLTKIDSIVSLVTKIKSIVENVDILANIAGIWHGKKEVYAGKNLETFTNDVVSDTFAVGLIAPTMLCKLLIPLFPKGSSIINLSGTFENGAKGWLPYYVSKRAIEDLTIGLSQELEEKEIKVNCVSPSDTATEEYKRFFPEDAEGAQTPNVVAELFLELIQKNVTGKVFVIKGGKTEESFHK